MRQSTSRRPGVTPGRRLSWAAALAIAALGGWPAAAVADQTVVSATIYPGTQGSVSSRSVLLSQLAPCPAYTGPNPMYLYPSGQPLQVPPDSTWTVSELLQCGLGIAPSQVSDLQVQTVSRGFEAPLTGTELTDPTEYQDPGAPGALPVLASDGTEDQNTYFRPYRGNGDDNTADQVVQSGAPIALVVYLNGAPLTVSASQQTVSQTATRKVVRLAATVHDASGAAVPAAALSWNWSFGDGETSASATPRHSFSAGVYYVTVEVTDAGAGSGGTATLEVSFDHSGRTGPSTQTGGATPTGSQRPTGSDHRRHPAAPASGTGTGTGHSTTPSTTSTPTTPTTTSTTASSATATTSSTATTTPAHRTATPRRPGRHRSPVRAHPRRAVARRVPVAPGGTPVSGELISDVTSLPAGSSPLVHATPAAVAPAAAVRPATGISAAPAVAATLAVLALLGLGAGRELRGQRRWPVPGADG